MIYLVGASCLYHLIHRKEHITERNWYHRISTSIPGLSVNYNTRKTVQDLLKNKLALRNRNRIVIWHDVINNSITEQKAMVCCEKLLPPTKLKRASRHPKRNQQEQTSRSNCLHPKARYTRSLSYPKENRHTHLGSH